jgi:hypothetical protein
MPPASRAVKACSGWPAADLVDPEHRDRLWLAGQQGWWRGGERLRDDRPRDAVVPGGLHDRAATVGDRRTGRLPQPGGQPGTGRDLGDLFG